MASLDVFPDPQELDFLKLEFLMGELKEPGQPRVHDPTWPHKLCHYQLASANNANDNNSWNDSRNNDW